MLRKILVSLGLLFAFAAIPGCDKDDDDDNNNNNIVQFSGTMNGANEVPAVTTTATGNVTGSYNTTSKILTLTITYNGLSSAITNWHVHKGAVGAFGPPVAGLTYGTLGNSPFTWTSTPLDAAMEADLMNNLWYVNIHTANNGGGEIRGQLTKQ